MENDANDMDERWVKALQTKGINVNRGARGRQSTQPVQSAQQVERHTRGRTPLSGAVPVHAKPFKATGHKGGISRQGA